MHRNNITGFLALIIFSFTINANAFDSWQKCDAMLRYHVLNIVPGESLYVRVCTKDDKQYVKKITIHELAQLHSKSEVAFIEYIRQFQPLLDASIIDIRADQVHAGILGTVYKGKDTFIGIVDSGIDWKHEDFIDLHGKTRIYGIWDQTDDSGSPPDGYSYGTYFSRDAIQLALDGQGPDVGGMDLWGHGTHVAGIAAGNGRAAGNSHLAGRYVGVAPEAELIIVKSGDRDFLENEILDGVQFCFNIGSAEARPVSVNLSVAASHYGPHDGTSSFESIIDQMLWTPGRSVSIACGNDGDKAIHFQGQSSGTQNYIVEFDLGSNNIGQRDFVAWNIWADSFSGALEISIVTPSGDTLGPILSGSTVNTWNTAEGSIYLDHASTGWQSQNNCYHSLLRINDSIDDNQIQDNMASGTWKLILSGAGASFDGWIFENSVTALITNNADYSTLMPEPANSNFSISVASYSTRENWPSLAANPWSPYALNVGAISDFSSSGPTRDGRQKPDISAPGEHIISTSSSMVLDIPTDYYIATDSVHRAWAGTSMSAPHVTGAVALLFEIDPSLSSSQIKGFLRGTTKKDEYTGSTGWDMGWHARWGSGKLDVLAAMTMSPVKYEEHLYPQQIRLHQNYPNPF
ncbi:S8 family peptidase, partial [bacterium]|nr:S8 family peptidase [bacterium]